MEQILLFLDIEGVLSVPGVEPKEQLPHASALSMYPVQGAKQLLQTILYVATRNYNRSDPKSSRF